MNPNISDNSNLITSLARYINDCTIETDKQNLHLSGAGATFILENKLAHYYKKKHVLTFCNATSALNALIASLELKNSHILSTPFNWGGSISPFLFNSKRIVFSSVETCTLNLDPNGLLSSLNDKTKIILSTDYNGIPADSYKIHNFASEHELFYISDSSQSFGSFRNYKPAGFFSDASILSFGPGKSFFGGEGGALITDNSDLFEKLVWISQHPDRQKKYFGLSAINQYSPLNGRLNPLSAILLNEYFEYYMSKTKTYQSFWFKIINKLKDQGLIEMPEQLIYPDSSSFFKIMLPITKNTDITDINIYIKKNDYPVIVESLIPICIPFDNEFRKQFMNKFNVSPSLRKQKKTLLNSTWIKLKTTNQL